MSRISHLSRRRLLGDTVGNSHANFDADPCMLKRAIGLRPLFIANARLGLCLAKTASVVLWVDHKAFLTSAVIS